MVSDISPSEQITTGTWFQGLTSLIAIIFHTPDQKHLCNVVCEKA